MKHFIMLIFFLLNTSVVMGWNEDDNRQLSGVAIKIESYRPVDIDNLPSEIDALQSGQDDSLHAFVKDFNGDGIVDYLFVSHPIICGTGGCPYVLVDGKSRKTIGEFFGSVVLLDQKINGYPVIQAISKYDASSSSVATHVFDGIGYKMVAVFLLEERGLTNWEENIAGKNLKRP